MHDEQGKNKNKPILIVPAAGRSSRFPDMKPKWMLTHHSGDLMIEKVIKGLDINQYKKIYFVILREQCDKYDADLILKQAFKEKKFEVVILDHPTNSSPQTVYECIKTTNINDWIVVKDCDSLVSYTHPTHSRFVVGLNIKDKPNTKNLHQKSFILSDENNIIQEIIEKNIVSEKFCVGLYALHSSDLVSTYEILTPNMKNELYFSDIISELIDKNVTFLTEHATKYEDWGTSEEWFSSEKLKNTYFFDIDGVLLANTGKYGRKNWFNTIEPIWENVEVVKKLCDDGHELIFVTSRPDNALLKVKAFLKKQNIQYKSIISSCLHSKRILINDFANTNPFPSCIAINIPRNSTLSPYIK